MAAGPSRQSGSAPAYEPVPSLQLTNSFYMGYPNCYESLPVRGNTIYNGCSSIPRTNKFLIFKVSYSVTSCSRMTRGSVVPATADDGFSFRDAKKRVHVVARLRVLEYIGFP